MVVLFLLMICFAIYLTTLMFYHSAQHHCMLFYYLKMVYNSYTCDIFM